VRVDAASLFDPEVQPERRILYVESCTGEYSFRALNDVFRAHSSEWTRMGQSAVWWSVLTGHNYGTAISADALRSYYAEGHAHVEYMLDRIAAAGLKLPPAAALPRGISTEALGHVLATSNSKGADVRQGTALDFGCGTARLSQAMLLTGRFQRIVCVDQSMPHLSVAVSEVQRRLGPLALSFQPLLSGPQLSARLDGMRFDTIISFITLQHMVPPLQAAYIEQLCEALTPGGAGFFDIPDYLDPKLNPPFDCNFDTFIARGGMQLHAMSRKEIRSHLERAGCEVVAMGDANHIGNAGTSVDVIFTKG
jgi:SAM-dependent methyltransferase